MANEVEKKALKAQKEAEKEKKLNQIKSMKAAAAKKPKKSIIQYFKDVKSEFKKVSWPSRKQVFNNTVVVLVTIVVSGIGIWVLDFLFSSAWSLMLGM